MEATETSCSNLSRALQKIYFFQKIPNPAKPCTSEKSFHFGSRFFHAPQKRKRRRQLGQPVGLTHFGPSQPIQKVETGASHGEMPPWPNWIRRRSPKPKIAGSSPAGGKENFWKAFSNCGLGYKKSPDAVSRVSDAREKLG